MTADPADKSARTPAEPGAGARRRRRHALNGVSAILLAISAGLLAPHSLEPLLRWVCAFDAGAVLYLGLVWTHLILAGDAVSAVAEQDDEGHLAATAIVIAVALAGLSAVIALATGQHTTFRLVLGVATIIICWLLLQTIFAAHYAAQYRAEQVDGDAYNGLDFPGGGPIRFLDFAYFAFTVGLTFQVSDVTTNTAGMRRIVMVHAILAFIFNTAIIAFAVSVATGWL